MPRSDDRGLLLDAVQEAGALAMRHFTDGTRHWEKKPGDPVSEADLAVDRLLQARLAGARPDYGWLSEETADDRVRVTRSRTWVVDPIDGTRAFVKGRPEFAVCAALVEDGEPVLGAVFNPATAEYFTAEAGGGARLNGHPIHASAHCGLEHLRLLASKRTFEHHAWLKRVPAAEFQQLNSIAYRMALVAAGRFEASVSLSEKADWDIAAADLIVREAGGAVTTTDGRGLRYNRPHPRHDSVIAAAPGVHAALIELLRGR